MGPRAHSFYVSEFHFSFLPVTLKLLGNMDLVFAYLQFLSTSCYRNKSGLPRSADSWLLKGKERCVQMV